MPKIRNELILKPFSRHLQTITLLLGSELPDEVLTLAISGIHRAKIEYSGALICKTELFTLPLVTRTLTLSLCVGLWQRF